MNIEQSHSNHEHASTSLKVILLIFVIVLVAALGYLVWDANNTPAPSESTAAPISTKKNTTEEKDLNCDNQIAPGTAGYTGDGYCFTHPAEWQLTEITTAEDGSSSLINLTDKVVPNSDYQGKMSVAVFASIAKLDSKNTGAENVKEYLDDYAAMDEPVFENIASTKVGGMDAYSAEELSQISDNTKVYFVTLGNNAIIKISLYAADEETMNILDTFEFTQY